MTSGADELLIVTRALITELGSTDIVEAEWEFGEFRVKIIRQTNPTDVVGPITTTVARKCTLPQETTPVAHAAAYNRNEVRSPMHGIFYAASEQSAPPFVTVGDTVTKGQVLCVLEAMKVFSDITCECDGKIVSIGPSNGQDIAPGDLLFEIEKSIERHGNAR